MKRLRGFRRRDVATWALAFACSLVVGCGEAHAAHWTVAKLVRHADGSAAACQVAPHWGPKQSRCSNMIVFRRDPAWLERQAWAIQGCESSHRTDPPGYYLGPAQFDPGTWRRLPHWLSQHSPHSPPWAQRAMRYVRHLDGDWHQWPACSRRLR